MRRSTRRTLAGVAATMLVPAVACVIADPPAQLPVPPLTQPWIESANVTPPVSLLQQWPSEFIIPVYSDDPSATIEWQAFLDYDPASPSSYDQAGELDPISSDDAGVRMLDAHISEPANINVCHTLEFLVAVTFSGHAPNPPGGDSITWFYSPTGSLADCPLYDAGPFDASEDAASDGSGTDDAGGLVNGGGG